MLPWNFTERSRIMVFAAHPDDETLSTGGLLQRAVAGGAAVRVVFATDGENNPWPQRAIERRWRIGAADRARWAERRRAEVLAALACLGVSSDHAVFLGYPDQGITELLLTGGKEPILKLSAQIVDWHPTHLVVPSKYDTHPDHSALAVLLDLALDRMDSASQSLVVLSYLTHTRPADSFHRDSLRLRLSPEQQARKLDAILCHTSQLALSRRRFLAYATDSESFLAMREAGERDDYRPARQASAGGASLRLELAMRANLGSFGKAKLCIVSDILKGDGIRLSVTLPRRSAEVAVCDAASRRAITCAHFCGNRRQGQLLIPLSALPSLRRIFVKLERRFGFFDEGGWREVQISQPPGGAKPFVCCVIPCYNVAGYCGEVVREAARYADRVIAVDDGSTDKTNEVLRRVAAESQGRVEVLSYANNRGKGVVLLEAFRYALARFPFEILVTLDGDKQHHPADIPRLIAKCRDENAEMVLGERTITAMPFRSRLGNTMASALLLRRHPWCPRDTQSGLRALKRDFVKEIVRIVKGGRYETELYILLLALRRGRRVATIPIEAIYLNRNISSHFRPVADAFRIYRAILNFRR